MLDPQERTSPVTGEPVPVTAPFSASPDTATSERWATLFPAEGSEAEPRPWWRRRWRLLVAAVVVLALVATTLVATDAFGSKAPVYRSATVADRPVSAVVDGVATIEPISQATVSFPVEGTVASVDVAVGQQVTAGQVLASLDTQTLMATLHTRQAALARAQLTLSKALAGESVGSPSAGSGGGNGNGGGGSSTAFQTASTTASPTGIVLTAAYSSSGGLAQAQQAVLQAQQHVDAALAAAQVAVQQEASVCANVTTSSQGTTGSAAGVHASGTLTACQTAIQNVVNAQQQVADAQAALAHATSALDALLGQRASSPGGQGGSQAPSGGSKGSGSGGSGFGGSGGSGGSRSGSGGASRGAVAASGPTAADLVAFQASVDAAEAQVAVAYQAVAQATIATPIPGTVMAVNLAAGDSVSAGSSTDNVVIAGSGGYEVSTTVGVTQIPDIALGQPATVVPDGSHRVLPGKVVQISTSPASSSDSSTTTTTYTVVVGLSDPTTHLNNGATGSVSIVTKRATSALAVPTSAIVTNGTRHSVTVLEGGKATSVNVRVGVLGATWTQVTNGLHRGQHVALATVSAPLPGSATSSTNGTNTNNGRGGGFGGGGLGGGGGGGFRIRLGGGTGG